MPAPAGALAVLDPATNVGQIGLLLAGDKVVLLENLRSFVERMMRLPPPTRPQGSTARCWASGAGLPWR